MKELPLVVGVTGASGVIYGIRLLEVLQQLKVSTHLVVSDAAKLNLQIETGREYEELIGLADKVHQVNDLAGSIASGSFLTRGMVVTPCTIKTLSAIANSFNYNLLVRAADVCLKEKRKLVLMVRETPLHQGHLELMLKAATLGAVILPPVPAFYHGPKTIQDLIDQSVGKVLDCFGIEHELFKRWS